MSSAVTLSDDIWEEVVALLQGDYEEVENGVTRRTLRALALTSRALSIMALRALWRNVSSLAGQVIPVINSFASEGRKFLVYETVSFNTSLWVIRRTPTREARDRAKEYLSYVRTFRTGLELDDAEFWPLLARCLESQEPLMPNLKWLYVSTSQDGGTVALSSLVALVLSPSIMRFSVGPQPLEDHSLLDMMRVQDCNLTRLELYGPMPLSIIPTIAALDSLRAIQISVSRETEPTTSIFDFIASLPQLQILDCDTYSFAMPIPFPSESITHTSLRELRISGLHDFIGDLINGIRLPGLVKMTLESPSGESISPRRELHRLLATHFPQIQHLDIRNLSPEFYVTFADLVPLFPLPLTFFACCPASMRFIELDFQMLLENLPVLRHFSMEMRRCNDAFKLLSIASRHPQLQQLSLTIAVRCFLSVDLRVGDEPPSNSLLVSLSLPCPERDIPRTGLEYRLLAARLFFLFPELIYVRIGPDLQPSREVQRIIESLRSGASEGVLSSSPISIPRTSPTRRRSRSPDELSDITSRAKHSPTVGARSFDPNDPQVRERQRTMDVDMAIHLSRARRETLSTGPVSPYESIKPHTLPSRSSPERTFPNLSGLSPHPEHDTESIPGMADDNPLVVHHEPSISNIQHLHQAHDPSLLVSLAPSTPPNVPDAAAISNFGLPIYQANAPHSAFNFTIMEDFAAAEKQRLGLNSPAITRFAPSTIRGKATITEGATPLPGQGAHLEEGTADSGSQGLRHRKLSTSTPNPRFRKGIGGKMALFESPSMPYDNVSGIPAPPGLTPTGILNTGHDRPYRFSFYSNSLSATIHARSLSELPADGQSFEDLFSGITQRSTDSSSGQQRQPALSTTDILGGVAPGPAGMNAPPPNFAEATSAFDGNNRRSLGVDAKMGQPSGDNDTDGKTCFDQDPYSPTHLEPLNMYMIVFREGILSFHFRPTPHPQNVRRRIKQLKDYISVTSDWISYALIDDITDAFGPLIQGIEYEVDSIDELVLILKEAEQSDMLRRIGTCRKKVMGLLRLMGNKADVVKGLAKRCNENWRVAPTSDIGLYLSDIQDHLITMTQSLNHYEKILSRSHSNYLAQISIEMTDANNQINNILSKLTALGTVLIPMNLVTGLWGMNVHVPGQFISGYAWFCSIVGGLIAFGVVGTYVAFRFMVPRK
ncbi:hypothetical protein NP233_g2265 [Leucocoprinus birnbaumii]|uniref:Uncharacterized protein n=1 Tax=Leucocoprinus birnbaumii TaxID=56174 RepID=A0AAD5VYL1_9AGAR|nr:hypothetical protein NP233_g2265 [Leucocoprinus birnbaumii]